jgi:predicted negative regulator of RcsB-dependent stress response
MKSILLVAFVITGFSGLTGLGYFYYKKVKRERQQKAQEIFKSVILAALQDKHNKTKQLKDVNK